MKSLGKEEEFPLLRIKELKNVKGKSPIAMNALISEHKVVI